MDVRLQIGHDIEGDTLKNFNVHTYIYIILCYIILDIFECILNDFEGVSAGKHLRTILSQRSADTVFKCEAELPFERPGIARPNSKLPTWS